MEPVSILIAALNGINHLDKAEKAIKAIDAILDFNDSLGEQYDELYEQVRIVRDGGGTIEDVIDNYRRRAREAHDVVRDM